VSTSDEEAVAMKKDRKGGNKIEIHPTYNGHRRPIESVEQLQIQKQFFELESLLHLLQLSEKVVPAHNMNEVVEWIAQFHQIAVDANIPLSSPKFRYLMKRAYLEYLMAVCPEYGCKFYDVAYILPIISILQGSILN